MKAIVRLSPQNLLEAFCKHYGNRDIKSILALFTKDAFVWGTGSDEVRRGLTEIEDQLKRDWSQSEACQLVIDGTETDPEERNWIGATVTANVVLGGKKESLSLRGTLITKLEEGKRKIRFLHTSFPANHQAVGQSFPKEIQNENQAVVNE